MRYLALIPLFVLAIIPNSQPTQLDTSKAERLVPSFFVAEKQEFPDRQTYTLQAKELDKQREIARLEAIKQAEASKVAEAKKNVPQAPTVAVSGDDIIMKLAYCESGARWTYNGSSGYDGAFQFSPGTWRGMGTAYEFAWQAPPDVQIDAAKRLIARSGWGQFPGCARKLGML